VVVIAAALLPKLIKALTVGKGPDSMSQLIIEISLERVNDLPIDCSASVSKIDMSTLQHVVIFDHTAPLDKAGQCTFINWPQVVTAGSQNV
jgi:hypothetical protein